MADDLGGLVILGEDRVECSALNQRDALFEWVLDRMEGTAPFTLQSRAPEVFPYLEALVQTGVAGRAPAGWSARHERDGYLVLWHFTRSAREIGGTPEERSVELRRAIEAGVFGIPEPERFTFRAGDVEADGLEGIRLRVRPGTEGLLGTVEARALAAWLLAQATLEERRP